MTFRPILLIIVVIALLSAGSLMAQDTPAGFPVTVTDMNGRSLTFDAPPQRVICLLNRCAQELAFIGVAPVAVGAPYTYNVARDPLNFGEQAESFGQIAQVDGVDLEQIAAYEPDLIIGEADIADAVAGIAPLYSYSWDASVWQTVDNFTTDVRNFGRIFGIEAEVDAKIQRVLDRVAAYDALAPDDRSHLVFFFNDDTGTSLWVPGDCGLFLSQLSPCGNPNGGDWIEGTIETLLAFDPDVLIVESYGVDDEAAMLARLNESDPLWGALTAVQNGDVHLVPVSQARTNTIQSVRGAVDTLMPLIYPDVFPAPLTDAQVADIVAGQTDSSAAAFPLTITDRAGATLTLEAPAERIFCLSEPCLHSLAALGQLPAGAWPFYYQYVVSDPALFGERAADIPILDGLDSVDLEAVAALDPDLIIAWPGAEAYLPPEFISTVAPVFTAGYDLLMPDLDVLGHDLRMIAAAVGQPDTADALLADLEARQAAYLTVLGDTPRREALVVRLEAPDTNSIWALPCGPLMAQIVACVNTADDWVQYAPESLLAADPDVLIVEDWGDNTGTFAPDSWTTAGVPLWDAIPAVSGGQTYYIPVIATAPYSPLAWRTALDTLMPLIYPDVFPAPLTDEQVTEILAGGS